MTHDVMDATIPDLADSRAAVLDPAHYRSLIEACPDPLIAVGVDGRIEDANQAFLAITGIPREKLIGSEFAGYFTDPELAHASYREALSRGVVTGYPLTIGRASGQLTHLLCNAGPYRTRENQAGGVVVIARDVSGQKAARRRAGPAKRRYDGTPRGVETTRSGDQADQ